MKDCLNVIKGMDLSGSVVKKLAANEEMWVWPLDQEYPRRRKWTPTPVFLPGQSHGKRNLVGCSPWGRRESDTTERLSRRRIKGMALDHRLFPEEQGRGVQMLRSFAQDQQWRAFQGHLASLLPSLNPRTPPHLFHNVLTLSGLPTMWFMIHS